MNDLTRAILFILGVVLVLLLVWLIADAAERSVDRDAVAMSTWGRTAPPYVVDGAATSTTTTTARARTAPTKPRTTMRAASVIPPGVLQDMIRAGFARFGPAVAEQAVHVAGCESTGDETGQRLDPGAVNGQHAGLFQLSRTYHEERARRLGFTWDQMFQPGPNITVAVDLFAEKGKWSPTWSCAWAA